MQRTIDSLPDYLRVYCVTQDADTYTAEDHAAWRFIMRQCRHFFDRHGVESYLEGLKKTGISTDHIPRIEDIDRALRSIGWGAVPVRGFIPPFAFLELQSRKILPIASDMRQADHILYTPAPDIVHEAAGHAPILADPAFARYITKYANLAKKAIFCEEDLEQYEAIRILSDIKENPDSTAAMIEEAEQALQKATDAVPFVSEAAKVARMYWWTAEYGLVGDLANPKIYGAGLLSSVGESQACLNLNVKKIPLSVACVDQSYDITKPQPQLFVARDLDHLSEVLDDLEDRMAYRIGGKYGLDVAKDGRTVVTVVLDSGVCVSGKVVAYEAAGDDVTFFRLQGPVQIAHHNNRDVSHDATELAGQGVQHHPDGFSSPISRWSAYPDKSPADLSKAELTKIGITNGSETTLEFISGFKVTGTVAHIEYRDDRPVLIKWTACKVTKGGAVYFDPSWGDFDMTVGDRVVSVYGGAADRERFGKYKLGEAKTSPKRSSLPSEDEKAVYRAFEETSALRAQVKKNAKDPSLASAVTATYEKGLKNFRDNWLLRLETIELLSGLNGETKAAVEAFQKDFAHFDAEMHPYIKRALEYVNEL